MYIKCIKTGYILEFYKSNIPWTKKKVDLLPKDPVKINAVINKYNRETEYKNRGHFRAMNHIRRLISGNFDNKSKLVTLTFRDTSDFNIKSVPDCYKQLSLFIKRLVYYYGDIKYVVVPEIQNKNNRGAVHFHMIVSLPYVDNKRLSSIWSLGFVRINLIDNIDRTSIYLTKYLSKTFNNINGVSKGFKRYYRSLNLIQPKVIYGEKAKNIYNRCFKHDNKITFRGGYESVYNGYIFYTEYSFNNFSIDGG